ncbi:MAG: nitroreductase family protein [Bacillota bacterium]|nr:nitroreductase family protein [Bacillota bacterium]MDW7676610.1 nitroreductase family protein [Bacillota bacterium]
MTPTVLYQTIFKRKSIRKYRMEGLPQSSIDAIDTAIQQVKLLDNSIRTEIKLFSQDAVKGFLAIKSPHYLLFFSEKKKGYLENAGFILQQLDLALSAMGLGTCWLGMAKPTSQFEGESVFPFVIALSVGIPEETLHRGGAEEFKRKTRQLICPTPYHAEIIEAARLAPSATNSQPWQFRTTEKAVHVYRMNTGLLKAWLYDRLNGIDMGIALCHLWLAATAKEFQVQFIHDLEAAEGHPIGAHYTLTMLLEPVHKFDPRHKAVLKDAWRQRNLPAQDVLKAMGLKSHDIVADVGCGTGYFSMAAAEIIYSEGTVYALDTSEEMLQETDKTMADHQRNKVVTMRTDNYDFKLPDASVTYVWMANVLHEVADRQEFLMEANRILPPGGRLALLEWDKKETPEGPPLHHRISLEEARTLLDMTGFRIVSEKSFAAHFYGMVAEKRSSQ